MSEKDKASTEKLFKAWLSDKKVMIADPSGPSRSGVAKFLVGIGAKSSNLQLVADFVTAKETLEKVKPALIVSDFNLPGGDGLALSQEAQTIYKDSMKVFTLLTSNSSQSLVAQAAEEDVDLFILKPYTLKQFTEELIKASLGKIYPSDYMKTIEAGKKLLYSSDPDAAIKKFDEAKSLSAKPTLALFYRGQAELFKRLVSAAETSYKEGLQLNDIHYKCLTGLFDLLMNQNKTADAYAIVKKISAVFPSNPKRLTQIIGLSIRTENYDDMEAYYEAFKGIETRDDNLVKYICAGLVVAAKHAINQGKGDLASDLLTKASITASGNVASYTILYEIVMTFADMNKVPEALKVLKKVPPSEHGSTPYLMAQFCVQAHESDSNRILLDIQALEKKGLRDPLLSYWKIKSLHALGRAEQAKECVLESEGKWPDKKAYFAGALK